MNPYLEQNRDRWDELVPIHAASEFYDLAGFRAGRCALTPIELEEVGDVSGRSLLHLQCHFGMDTLSWARRGARVTGVDFSQPAIERATALARELDLEARFLCSDIGALPPELDDSFDVVFTSRGVLCWLPDLTAWGQTIARCLVPGGRFVVFDSHPFVHTLDDETTSPELRAVHPYRSSEPFRWESSQTYTDAAVPVQNTVSYEWHHGLGDIVAALTSAGLVVESLREHTVAFHRQLPFMALGDDGWWRLPEGLPAVPLTFSLQASLP